jgi:hypothetical protein
MKKLFVFIAVFVSSVSFSQRIDIHVTKGFFTETLMNSNTITHSEYKDLNSFYYLDLNDNILEYKCPTYNLNLTRKIISKTFKQGIYTITYEDDDLHIPNVTYISTLKIDTNTNSIVWINPMESDSIILKCFFKEFEMKIKEKS